MTGAWEKDILQQKTVFSQCVCSLTSLAAECLVAVPAPLFHTTATSFPPLDNAHGYGWLSLLYS